MKGQAINATLGGRADDSLHLRRTMLKRVCSHKKTKKTSLLHVGPALTNAKRSRSLTQIDRLGVQNPDDMSAERKSEAQDHLLVPGPTSELDNTRSRIYQLPRKIPSQEFFSVAFDILNEPGYEILPASRNVTLKDALQCLLERRGLDINKVEVFLESSFSSPLSLLLETYRLGGNNLHVRAKEVQRGRFSRTNSMEGSSSFNCRFRGEKKKSGSCKGRKSTEVSSDQASGEEHEVAWWRTKKKSTPGLLGNSSKDKMETLSELLNLYSQEGIPQMPGLLTFSEYHDEAFFLEDHWSSFVHNSRELPKRTQNQQDAIWELIETEVFFIRRLKIVTDLFIACLCNLQSECILNEIDTDKMFSNLREVSLANQQFWMEHLLPMLQASRASGQQLNPMHMYQGFTMFDQLFHPYIKYCSEHSVCLQYVKEKHRVNDLFKTYVAWCETQKDCERLRLTDLLVKPMQRLTKYSLLLKAIHKKTDSVEVQKALLDMNQKVEHFVFQVDAILRKIHEQERLSSIIERIESYQVVDSGQDELQKLLKDYSVFDLTCPMPGCGIHQRRELLLEGSAMKLRDSSANKVDVHCFLFTDMLLICKSQGKKGDKVRVIRQPYVVDRLVVQEMSSGGLLLVYLNEYQVATAAFALYTADSKLWLENIRKSQEQLKEARSAESQLFGYLGTLQEEDDYYFPSTALLVARSSSRCSLTHSRSGSIDISDTSGILLPVSPTKKLNHRTVSVELSDLRTSSVSSDASGGRPSSPRPERRAFLLRGSGSSLSSPNTLSVGVSPRHADKDSTPTIQLPTSPKSPLLSPKSLQRCMATGGAKPPLLGKTVIVHSAPTSKGPSPIQSFDSDSCLNQLGMLHPPVLGTDHLSPNYVADGDELVVCKPVFRSEPNIKIQVAEVVDPSRESHRTRRFLLARCSSEASEI